MKFRITLIIMAMVGGTLLLQACSRPLSPQDSCNFVQNPDMQRVSWKGALPVKLYVDSSFPANALPALEAAIKTYNTKDGPNSQQLFQLMAGTNPGASSPTKDGYSVIYWLGQWDTDSTTEQARTTIYWSGNEIFEADMRVNAQSFLYNYSDGTQFTNVDLQSLFLHELGHVLGLAHNTLPDSAMEAVLNYGQVRRNLGADDLTDLKCEY